LESECAAGLKVKSGPGGGVASLARDQIGCRTAEFSSPLIVTFVGLFRAEFPVAHHASVHVFELGNHALKLRRTRDSLRPA
jgi:hypothetical protein